MIMTTHYLNRKTRYHIGNNYYSGSVDKEFINAYPVIGQAWAQPFSVSHDDKVEIIIENLWGVDYGNNNRVYIGSNEIGEIRGEHNRKGWSSPSVWNLKAGKTYLLKIASLGPGDPDDFVFEGVIIRTKSDSKLIKKGKPKILRNIDDDYWSSDYDHGETQPSKVMESPTIGQLYWASEKVPSDIIDKYWKKGYYITFLSFINNLWVLVMTKGVSFKSQFYSFKNEFPKNDIKEKRNKGFSITDIAYGNKMWAVILSKPTGHKKQWTMINDQFPKVDLKKHWKKSNFYITRLNCFAQNYWILVLSEMGKNYKQAYVSTSNPKKAISEYPDSFAVTDITYGDGAWVIVFSEEHPYKEQSVIFSSNFPEKSIIYNWNQGNKITSITYGKDRWALLMHKE